MTTQQQRGKRSALGRLRGSMLATAAALSAMITGCAVIRPAKPAMSADFVGGKAPVQSLAILPIDLSVQTKGKPPRPPKLNRELLARGLRALVAGLQKRGYPVRALVGADGSATTTDHRSFGVVIHHEDLAALRVRLHEVTRGYHTAALVREAMQDPRLAGKVRLIEAEVDPALAKSLAVATNTDASLYTRAWAYIVPGDSAGATAAKVILAMLAVVLIVGAFVALFAARGKGGKGSLRRGSRGSRGVARGARAVGKIFGAVGRVALHTAVAVSHARARHCHRSRCAPPPPPCHSCAPPPVRQAPGHEVPAPPPGARPRPQQTTLRMVRGVPKRSTVGMAMSMLSNKTGKVLWHVEQQVPLRLEGGGDVERLVEHFLRTLPTQR